MASYHSSFSYNDKNSAKNYGLIITSFEPDNGFVDSFLAMDNVSDDYYDGTKKYNYGAKYNTQASIQITLIKRDGSDMTLNEFRAYSRWLTGAHVDSWLDMYVGDMFVYSFLGKFTNLEQYKLDGRTVGIRMTFSSVSPWAYSAPREFYETIKQTLTVNNGVLINDPVEKLSVTSDGVLYYDGDDDACFLIDDSGVVYIDNNITRQENNQTDDIYNYIYLDITFENESCDGLKIINQTLDETTEIKNLAAGDVIRLSAKQFITSQIDPKRVFGEDFNFVWPRLAPGQNDFYITGQGNGVVKFTYRYPMKVGDNTMDISVYGGGTACGDCDAIPSYNTVRWEDIIGTPTTLGGYGIEDDINAKLENVDVEWGNIANTPTTIAGYGITDVYTKDETANKLANISVKWENVKDTPTTVEGYKISNAYTKSDVYTKAEVDDKIDDIEISGGTGGGGSTKIDEEELNSMLNDILGT
jgi:hypothetical protein